MRLNLGTNSIALQEEWAQWYSMQPSNRISELSPVVLTPMILQPRVGATIPAAPLTGLADGDGKNKPRTTLMDTGQKLDRLLVLIEGAGNDAPPGILHRLNQYDELLLGKAGEGGIVSKVNLMWRAHIWILCTFSAGAGFFLKVGLETLVKP